jgi:hypothetical protein
MAPPTDTLQGKALILPSAPLRSISTAGSPGQKEDELQHSLNRCLASQRGRQFPTNRLRTENKHNSLKPSGLVPVLGETDVESRHEIASEADLLHDKGRT